MNILVRMAGGMTFILLSTYWKCNFPVTPPVRASVGWCHKGHFPATIGEPVMFQCTYSQYFCKL